MKITEINLHKLLAIKEDSSIHIHSVFHPSLAQKKRWQLDSINLLWEATARMLHAESG